MGKKNKRAGSDPSTPQSQKRIKTEGSSSPLSLPILKYEDMPSTFKKKIYLNDDCGTQRSYIQLLAWIRTLGSMNGSTFEEIPNLNCSEGYPLLEVEVIAPSKKSAKFLICRDTLYLIAFTANGSKWMQYNCQFEIEGFIMLEYTGKYTTKPWEHIGPMCMIKALDELNTRGKLPYDYVKASEIFFVHLSEAARLRPIESLVCRSLCTIRGGKDNCFEVPFKDEELALLDNSTSDQSDVLSAMKEEEVVDYTLTIKTRSYIKNMLKKYSNLSKIWYVYALTDKKVFPTPQNVSELGLKSRKSLRCTLAVLCNVNLEKVLLQWRNKTSVVSLEMMSEMERRVAELQAQKKVLPKT